MNLNSSLTFVVRIAVIYLFSTDPAAKLRFPAQASKQARSVNLLGGVFGARIAINHESLWWVSFEACVTQRKRWVQFPTRGNFLVASPSVARCCRALSQLHMVQRLQAPAMPSLSGTCMVKPSGKHSLPSGCPAPLLLTGFG